MLVCIHLKFRSDRSTEAHAILIISVFIDCNRSLKAEVILWTAIGVNSFKAYYTLELTNLTQTYTVESVNKYQKNETKLSDD